jgi:hypothetical protein
MLSILRLCVLLQQVDFLTECLYDCFSVSLRHCTQQLNQPIHGGTRKGLPQFKDLIGNGRGSQFIDFCINDGTGLMKPCQHMFVVVFPHFFIRSKWG